MLAKKTLIIFTFTVFCFCIIYGPILFCIQQYVKMEMKSQISAGNYSEEHLLVITENNQKKIGWLEDDEISYEGNIYDVAGSYHDKNGSRVLKIIKDWKEQNILKSLIRLTCSDIPLDKMDSQPFKFISILDYSFISEIKARCLYEMEGRKPELNILIPAPYVDITSPPPKTGI